MTTKITPKLEFPQTLDNTILSCASGCMREVFWAHMLHLKPKVPSIHLHAGKAYAAMLETFRQAYYDPDSPTHEDLDESIIPALRRFLTVYGYDEELEASPGWIDSAKTPIRMLECFLQMLDEYGPKNNPVKPAIIDGKPAIELSFSIPLGINHPVHDDPILYHGRFDMIAEFREQYFVYDDKTCSQLGPKWPDQWEFRSQFTGYAVGAETYGVRIDGAIVLGHCIQKTQFKFAQPISYRKPYMKEQWWNDAHYMTHLVVESYKRAKADEEELGTLATRKHFPATGMFNGQCEKYGGCAYRSLCSTEHPKRWLSNYVIRVWDPTNPDKDD